MTKEEAWQERCELLHKSIDFADFSCGWDAAISSLMDDSNESVQDSKIPFHEIITYLNETTGKHFKNVNATKDRIRARWKEGYRLDDFKHVIKSKCDQWIRDKDMCIYLRPETLFGTKFDAYLNETPKVRSAIEEWQ